MNERVDTLVGGIAPPAITPEELEAPKAPEGENPLAKKITLGSLLAFTAPTILMMLCTSLYSIIDGVFVSQFVSTDALSAVNIVWPLPSIVIAIATMFGTGISAVVTKKLGENKPMEAKENFTFVTLVAGIVGIVFAMVSLVFAEPIIRALGANDAIYEYCRQYALPLILFLPASMLQLQFQYALVANGRPMLGLKISLISGLVNGVLDFLFVVVFGWGVAGAAIATGIGYAIPAVFGIIYFSVNRQGALYFVKPKTDWRVLVASITNGSSEMVSNLSVSITTFLFNVTMMHFLGQDGVAAITIVLYIDFMLVAVNMGYSMGIAPLISYNHGAKEHGKLKSIFKLSTIITLIFSLAVTIGTALFAEPLVQIFAKSGTAVFEFAVMGLSIYALGYLFKGFNIFASALFTAYSNGKISALLSFVRTLVFIVASMLLLTAIFGAKGVWYSVPAAECLTLIVSIVALMKYRKAYHYL